MIPAKLLVVILKDDYGDPARGESYELVYFYPSTEWHMAQPFFCACGASDCLGRIDGAARLTDAQLAPYALSPFVKARRAAQPLVPGAVERLS